jgi:hypothetical protein
MKILLPLLISPLFCISQKLTENQVDEFTKNTVKRTSWEPLSKTGRMYAHVRAAKINDKYSLDLKLMFKEGLLYGTSVFAVKDGQNVMLKLDNDSIVKLDVLKYEISCRGCGAINLIGSDGQGVHLIMLLDKETVAYLSGNKVVKIRVYTTDGYTESDIKEKHQQSISSLFKLLE